jgi:hypothetical protein
MILTPDLPGRQRPVGGPSPSVYYPRAGYDALGPAGVLVEDKDPLRVDQRPFPNANGATPFAPGSALVPQQNS